MEKPTACCVVEATNEKNKKNFSQDFVNSYSELKRKMHIKANHEIIIRLMQRVNESIMELSGFPGEHWSHVIDCIQESFYEYGIIIRRNTDIKNIKAKSTRNSNE